MFGLEKKIKPIIVDLISAIEELQLALSETDPKKRAVHIEHSREALTVGRAGAEDFLGPLEEATNCRDGREFSSVTISAPPAPSSSGGGLDDLLRKK